MSAGRIVRLALVRLFRTLIPKPAGLTVDEVMLAQHFAWVRLSERRSERLHGSPECQERIKTGYSLALKRTLEPDELVPAFHQAEVFYRMTFMGNYLLEVLPAPPPARVLRRMEQRQEPHVRRFPSRRRT